MRPKTQLLLGISIIALLIGFFLLFIPAWQTLGILLLVGALTFFALFLYLDWDNYDAYVKQRERRTNRRVTRHNRKSEHTLRYLEAFIQERMDRTYRGNETEDEWED